MKEFDKCFNTRRKINDIDEDIYELRCAVGSPRNQIITDMPKGSGGTGNALDNAVIKLEKLERKRKLILSRLEEEWVVCESIMKACNISEKHKEVMRLRYFKGLSWSKCLKAIKEEYSEEKWNDNKIYRIHRRVLLICTKRTYNFG